MFRAKLQILFTCTQKDDGVIAALVPEKSYRPDVFRKPPAIGPQVKTVTNSGLTIKRSLLFLYAMTTGWILPLAADLRLDTAGCSAKVKAG